jgi:hypothetical protein
MVGRARRILGEASGRRRCSGTTALAGAAVVLGVVVRAGRQPGLAGLVDLLVLEPADDVQVPLPVASRVPADQPGVSELLEVVLDVDGCVLGTQGPENPGNDRCVVAVTALVVGLSEEPDVGEHGGDRALGAPLVGEQVRLDRANARHVSGPRREEPATRCRDGRRS